MRRVAGRELVDQSGKQARWGGWIRPVSSHDEGALDAGERRLANAPDARPLDVVRISLELPENSQLQPENWLIHKGEAWTKDSVVDAQRLLPLIEEPENLWLDPTQKNDRASEAFLQRVPNLQSLYLIRPDVFQFHIRSRVWEGYAKKQQRGLFTYRGQQYDFQSLASQICDCKHYLHGYSLN